MASAVALPDGCCVRMRQRRGSDGELLIRAIDDLRPESRYRRFLASLSALSEWLLRYLTAISPRAHAEGIGRPLR